jgi:hypothetical protein
VRPKKPLHIDIPVKLSDVKVVFSIEALAFEADLPASMFHMQLIKNDYRGLERDLGDCRSLPYQCRACDSA